MYLRSSNPYLYSGPFNCPAFQGENEYYQKSHHQYVNDLENKYISYHHPIMAKVKQPLSIFKSSDYPCFVALHFTLTSLCSISFLRSSSFYFTKGKASTHTLYTAKVFNKCWIKAWHVSYKGISLGHSKSQLALTILFLWSPRFSG